MLVHFYDISSGKITIGGQDITQMSLESLNQLISYVAQEQFLFNTSILENVRIGIPDATDAEVMNALERAQCLDFIEKLPEGVIPWQVTAAINSQEARNNVSLWQGHC